MKAIFSKLAEAAAWRLLKLAYRDEMNGVELLGCLRGYPEGGVTKQESRFVFYKNGREK